MLRRIQVLTLVGASVAIGVALMLASCAVFQRGAKAPPPPPPTPTPVAAARPAVYYSSVEGLKVYSEPSTRSKVVGSLSLHERVSRTKLERGYAYVESAKGGLKGWVVNAQLIWRVPAAPAAEEAQPEETVAPAAEEPQAPMATEAAPAAAEPPPAATPAAAVPPRPKPTPGGLAPSIFNPY